MPSRGSLDGDDVVVRTQISQTNAAPVGVDYRLEKTPQGWKIYDMNVEGIWLIENYRNQFAQQINQNGIDGLIQALNQRNHRRPAPASASPACRGAPGFSLPCRAMTPRVSAQCQDGTRGRISPERPGPPRGHRRVAPPCVYIMTDSRFAGRPARPQTWSPLWSSLVIPGQPLVPGKPPTPPPCPQSASKTYPIYAPRSRGLQAVRPRARRASRP